MKLFLAGFKNFECCCDDFEFYYLGKIFYIIKEKNMMEKMSEGIIGIYSERKFADGTQFRCYVKDGDIFFGYDDYIPVEDFIEIMFRIMKKSGIDFEQEDVENVKRWLKMWG